MRHKVKNWMTRHFQDNFVIYFTMSILLIIGIVIGAMSIKVLNAEQKNQIISFFNSFFKLISKDKVNNSKLLKESILNNFRTILIIWITGAIIIGIPIIPVVVIFRGFALGFTVGFLVNEFGFKGFLFSLFSILPQNLFIVPGIISISSIGIRFSLNNIKGKKIRINNSNVFTNFISYSGLILLVSFVILVGSLVEAYITPIFMKLISEYIY